MTSPEAAQKVRRPKLTLPDDEAAFLRDRYARAEVILEYGAGGSTVLGAELGKTVVSVESDPTWIEMLNAWFARNPPAVMPEIMHADIGETGAWGFPADDRAYERFTAYSLGVWELEGVPQPDLVLIDGRFRVGCLLACLFRSRRPVEVLFDDYVPRKAYHVAEDYAELVETVGRMARFRVEPRAIRNAELLEVTELLLKKR